MSARRSIASVRNSDRAAILTARAEDPSTQRQQVEGDHLHAQLGVELLGALERRQRAVEVAALGQDLRQRLVAARLLGAVREPVRRLEALLRRAARLGQLAQLGEVKREVRQVERRAR